MILQPGAPHAAPGCLALKASEELGTNKQTPCTAGTEQVWGQTPDGRSRQGCPSPGRHRAGRIPIPAAPSSSTRLFPDVAPEIVPVNPSQGHLARLYRFCFLCILGKKLQRLLHKHIPPVSPFPGISLNKRKKGKPKADDP